jgi:threonyl-tRNA synthetase
MINIKENQKLNVLNHSAAHLLAHAVTRLYKDALLWVGPVIEEGFYYDIDLGNITLNEEDLDKIAKEMKKISKDNKLIKKLDLTKEEALEMFKDNPYKIELINNMDDNISAYKQDEFVDLCRGPHVNSTKEIKYFKLLRVSGSYYKGDSKNKPMQRIYGICFETEDELNSHLEELEEAKNRDHRKIGKEQELFMNHELVGSGFPLWLPNGSIVRKNLENYILEKEIKLGYNHVYTPCIATTDLYKISGHFDHYKDNMFPIMSVDNEEYVLRPMNCPHHMLIYKNNLHSYRDLPVRIGELATDFRYEASGAVCGLERVRMMCQNDAHLFVRPNQIKEEFTKVVHLILDVYNDFNIKNYKFRLSLRDKEDKEKYYPDDKMWDDAENILRDVLNSLNITYYEAIGEAAFYGPKLDVEIKSAIGHELTLSTCQLDFLLPEKFDLTYVDSDGLKKRPVVLHRAILGTIDRFMAFLIEETKGNFPLWLAPTQVNIIPVNNEFHLEYCLKLEELFKKENFRVNLDKREEKLGFKVRESNLKKIPYILIIGDNEVNEEMISYRTFGNNETVTLKINDFIALLNSKIKDKN